MSRAKLLTIALVVLVLLNLGTLGFLFFRENPSVHRPHAPRGEGPKYIIIERLGFNTAQQVEYEVLVKEHRSENRKLQQLSRELHDELYSLLKEDSGYQAKADSLISEISLNQKAMDQLNFDHFLKIKAICKGEQIQKFNVLASDLAGLFSHEGPPR